MVEKNLISYKYNTGKTRKIFYLTERGLRLLETLTNNEFFDVIKIKETLN